MHDTSCIWEGSRGEVETLNWLQRYGPQKFGVDGFNASDFQLGLTKVFFKLGKIDMLDELNNADLETGGEVAKQVAESARACIYYSSYDVQQL